MVTFLFTGCRLIDPARTFGLGSLRRSSDLKTGRLRPTWHDHYLMRQTSLDAPQLPARQTSFDFTGQALIDQDEFELQWSRGDFGSCGDLAQQINQQGFGLLKIQDPHWEALLDQVRAQLEPHVDLKKLAAGQLEPTRFQDAWMHLSVEAVRQVACHPRSWLLCECCTDAFHSFPNVDFNGTAQHFHSDAVHFIPSPWFYVVLGLRWRTSVLTAVLWLLPGGHRARLGLTQAEVLAEPAPRNF